jgi:REP element-mobilizing transposase RayT
MSRDLRPFAINTIYHVTARGNNRDDIFLSDKDRETYLRLWRKYSQELGCDVYAYVLMTNHVHWLVRIGRVPISGVIHSIHSVYARIFNQANERVGHVFQGRFGSQVCMDDKYILSLCRYIHRNPLKAGLVENLSQYPWSSYPDLCGKRNDTLVNRGFWSDYFNRSVAKELRELVEGVAYEPVSEPAPQIKQPRLIITNDNKKEKRPDLDKLAGIIAIGLQTNTEELQGEGRLQNCVQARKKFIIEAVRNHAYRRSEVARYLKKDRSWVTRVLQEPL